MVAAVYEIKNIVNGKFYIGSSANYERRIRVHKTELRCNRHHNPHLQAAWLKYGESTFKFAALIVCAPETMRFYEQLCIDRLAPQYNKSNSAYSGVPVGATLSGEHKRKIGATSEKLWKTPEYRNTVTLAIQVAMTEEEKSKRSERTRKLWENPEYRARAVSARVGNAYSKGHKCTPEQIQNRKRAARISNMKRNYGAGWPEEYVRRYPEHAGDINA
jgi:group I intron endonuclease